MTPEQQRIAIAQSCGYKDVATRMTEGTIRVTTGFKHHTFDEEIPDYLNDLNAMHEAEKTLWEIDWNNRHVFNDNLANTLKGRTVNRNEWDAETLLDSTAAQRAEAFIRTTGKWVES